MQNYTFFEQNLLKKFLFLGSFCNFEVPFLPFVALEQKVLPLLAGKIRIRPSADPFSPPPPA